MRSSSQLATIRVEKQISATMLSQTLKLRFHFFAVCVLSRALFQSSAYCLESAGQIIQNLDTHYYYPQKQGLNKLSVRIEWEQLDVSNDKERYLKNPPVQFIWKNSPTGSRSIFKLADDSFEVSAERKKELMNLLENYKEVVIPQTLLQKMAGYQGRVTLAKKRTRIVEFESRKPGADIQKYSLVVDLDQKNVSKLIIERKDAPFKVSSHLRYTRKNGKWLLTESRSNFSIGGMDYHVTMEYVYRRAGTFWLVGKMTQTVKMDDRTLQSFIFRFRDYQIN